MTAKLAQPAGRTSLADLCIRRPVFAAVMNIFLLVVGWISLREMGVDQFPNVDIPSITVSAAMPGASPEEMETSVAKPLEEVINTIEGVDELSSRSTEGACSINVQFLFSRTKDAAAQDVRDKVNQILPRLPRGIEAPVISKFDADASPIMQICVSGQRSMKELSFIAQRQIKERLETVANVGSVQLAGQRRRAVQIAADLDRLRAYDLTIADLRAALAAQNVEVPGGRVDQATRELTLRTLGRVGKVDDFGDLNLASRGSVPIKLRDVATVTDGVEEPRTLTRLNGENTVSLIVRKQSGTNTVEVIHGVKARLAELELPPDVRVEVMRDQSRFIERSLDEVSLHLLLGAVLVALTVFLFLHDWRGTLIASLAIPTSIIATFVLLRAMGYTLNNFTMLGLVFAVGIVVDDAIVVVENIHRTLEERALSARDAAMVATREIALAVLATTLSLVVIFLPIPFMEGRTGRFFASYGVTVAFAILVSMFVSFTLTPMLGSRLLKHTADEKLRQKRARGGMLMRALARWYDALLGWSLRHRWVVVLAAAGTMLTLGPLWNRTGVNFMPQDDSSEFEITAVAPEGWTLQQTSDVVARIEDGLREIKIDGQQAVTDTLVTVGDTSGRSARGEGGVTTANIYCRLPELGGRIAQWRGESRSWAQPEAMAAARRVLAAFPDFRSSVQTIFRVSGSGSRNADIEIGLTGPELGTLVSLSEQLMSRLRDTGTFMDVDTTLSNRKPELQARIDRDKASQFGVSVQEVASTLRTAVGGEIVSTWKEGDEQYDVWLRAEIGDRGSQEAIAQTAVRVAGRGLLPLTNFVRFTEARGPGEIERYQRTRKVAVLANLSGIALNEGMARAREVVARMDLPAGYDIVFTGRARSLDQTIFSFLKALLLSALFMYLILAAQFEHFIQPVSILLAAPLSLPFALLAMIWLGQPLDIYAFFGVFMLFGVVKKNGILQVDYTNVLRARGLARDEAIRQANRVRLRPILMTTLLLVASMIPIALGTGPGSAGRASMAKVIIGGQMLCLLLTLLVTPVTYSIFDDWGRGVFWRRKKNADGIES